jgi:hypothetical protein|tara:strand:- start:1613 stop:2176 length:564 start_codon:yes stop_codon:yes gene_type:complete
MAIKFDFNKLRTAIKKFTAGVDTSNGALAAGDEAKFAPHMVVARPVEALTNASAVTRQLTTAESGTLYTVDLSAVDNDITITLPTAATSAGVYYDFCFLVDSDDDADFILTTGADAVDFYGTIAHGAANSTARDVDGDASKLTIDGSASQDLEGMRITCLCDGANWHLTGYNTVAIATASVVLSASA